MLQQALKMRRIRMFSSSSSSFVVDLRSDTVTKPTERMRKAMSAALVGDDVYGEDPTVNDLEKLGAQLTGKESCCFVATGTMGNLASFLSHCDRRSSEIIVGTMNHTYLHEQGGSAMLGGIHTRSIPNEVDGTLDLSAVRKAIRPCTGSDLDDGHYPRTVLVSIENTHNVCGGIPIGVDYLRKLKEVISPFNVKLHIDGARICNAAVALGHSLAKCVESADSLTICLSKGLGCPVGTLVCGEEYFVRRVRRNRKALGGGWRQAGVVASAGLIALETYEHVLSETIVAHKY